ncbi:MAG: YicC/YloC family endoribonuclease [Gammaproteobacteria bacterium]
MIRSMTGFARGEDRGEGGVLAWEVRSVNHRYLETHLRLPEEFRPLEPAVRELVGRRLGRGKVDCQLRFEAGEAGGVGLAVDEDLARELVRAAERLADVAGQPARLTPSELLRWPGVVRQPELDLAPVHERALALLGEVLDDLVESRRREGERIARMIEERCAQMAGLVAAARERLPAVRELIRERYRERLATLQIEADAERLEQEMALIAQKMDVDEELDRLDSHVTEVRDILGRSEPVGRRLDFLMQEFNREANTLGSKSQDTETTRISVDMKVLIEQMREQIQNIE